MSQPFIGTIMMFGGTFAPSGWMLCAGQTLAISQYESLYALIGTTYGGDGQTTFKLPDLQGRVCVGQGQGPGLANYVIGQAAGTESVTLSQQQMPQHNHIMQTLSGTAGNAAVPASNLYLADQTGSGTDGSASIFVAGGTGTQQALANGSIGQYGGNQPHENRQPILAVTICISLFGVYPTQN